MILYVYYFTKTYSHNTSHLVVACLAESNRISNQDQVDLYVEMAYLFLVEIMYDTPTEPPYIKSSYLVIFIRFLQAQSSGYY